ncbi:MAG: hypothetical protein ABI036_12985 [Fibrobacteria bacterium]
MKTKRGYPLAFVPLILGGCIMGSKTEYGGSFSKADAFALISENERKWQDDEKSYKYGYRLWEGLYSSTKYGNCQVSDTVICTWVDAISDGGVSKEPGRLQRYFDLIRDKLGDIEPDSVGKLSPNAFIVYENKAANDSLNLPVGYSVWFNPDFGYPDSIIFYPFGPALRIDSLSLKK